MWENPVKRAWKEGKTTVGAWLSLPNSFTAELMAQQGFDWLTVDMQHGLIDYGDAVHMLTAISTTDVTPFVRVPWNDPATIMKVLDAGAYGVVVPLINNPDEARRAVGACRYPPFGYRSSGPIRASVHCGPDYQSCANDNIAAILTDRNQGRHRQSRRDPQRRRGGRDLRRAVGPQLRPRVAPTNGQ